MEINNHFFENFPLGIIYQNENGDVTEVNKVAKKIFGLSNNVFKDIKYWNLDWKVIKSDGSDYSYEDFPAVQTLKTGKPINNIVIGILKPEAKNYFWIKIHTVPEFKDGENKAFRVYSVIEDVTESQNWKDKLLQSEKKYKALIETSNDSIFIIQDGEIKYANPQLIKISRYSEEQLLEKKFVDFVAPHEVEKVIEYYKKRILGEEVSARYESVAVTKNGDYIDVEVSVIPFVFENAPATQIVLSDISKRKKAENKFLESEKNFREFTDLLPEIVFEVDSDLNILYINNALEEKTGLSINDFFEKKTSVLDLLDDNDKQRFVNNVSKNLTGELLSGHAFKFVYSGKDIYLRIFSSPVFKNDKIIGIRGIAVDITESKIFEEKLKESEEKLNSIVQGSQSAIFTINEDQKFTFVNEAGLKLFGYSENEIINCNFQIIVHKDSMKFVTEQYQKRQDGKQVPSKYRFSVVKKDGTKRRVEITSSVITSSIGKPITVANITDVTEEEERQNTVVEAKQRLNAFFNANSDLMFIKNSNRCYIELNDEMCKFFDKTKEEILGKKDEELALTDNIQPCPSSDKRVLKEKSVITVEEKLGDRIFNVTKFPIILNNDILIGGILHDITDSKKAEEELQMKDDAIDSFINAIGITDLEGKVIYANDATVKLWQYSREEMYGQPIDKIWVSDGVSNAMDDIINKGYSYGEDISKRKDGSEFDLQYSATLVKNKLGESKYIFGSFVDISRRKRHEKLQKILLNISQKSVSNITLWDFIANIHQQIKTIVKADNFYLALYHKNTGLYNFPYYVDEYENVDGEVYEKLDNSLTNYIRKTEKGQIFTNVTFNEISKKEGFISIGEYSPNWVWMGAPIVNSYLNEAIGVLTVQDYNDEYVYNNDDLVALEIIAGYIGQFIERLQSIDELKKAKQIAQENEIRYKALFNNSASVMMILDVDTGDIVDVNQSACEYYGYSYEEITNINIGQINILPEKDLKAEMQKIKNDERTHFFFKHRLKNGQIKDVEVYSGKVVVKGKILLNSIVHDITKRREAEEGVRKLSASVEQSPVTTIITDIKGNIQYVNKVFTDITGYKINEVIGKNPKILQSGKTSAQTYKILWDTVLHGETWNGEFVNRKKNGQEYIEKATISQIRDESGKITHLLATKEDITEKKKAEEEIARLYKAIKQATEPIALTNLEGHFIFVNPRYCELSGYSEEELLGEHTRILKSGKQSNAFYEELWNTITSGDIWSGEIINKKKNGDLFIEEVNITPILNDQDVFTHYLKVSRDVTQTRIIEKELANHRHKLQVILDNMPGGYIMIDENYIIQQVNKQVSNITGYKQDELIGNLCDIVCPKGSLSKDCPIWAGGTKSFTGMDTTIKCKDGSKTPIIKNAETISLNGRNFIIESFQDISNLKKTEIDLVSAKEKAEESDRLKSAFLANMSHEIRTPMNGILGFTNLLNESNFSDTDKKYFIKSIQKSGNRMLNTVNDIIEISKIEIGEVTLRKKKINLNEKITEIIDFFIPEAHDKKLKLVGDLPLHNELTDIETDESKFESIVTNLVKNAIKYSDKGTIKFGYKVGNNNIEFYCQDEGIGVPKNRQAAIFNRFEQADIEDARAFQGSGLGLAIIKAYVEKLGGKIWVESVEGEGSVFYFTLPFSLSKPQKKNKIADIIDSKKDVENRELKILIAEDDETSISYLKAILENHTNKLIFAVNGTEALEMVKLQPDIDVVLMDIQMPLMDGYTATKKIREFNKEVKIIAQTAFALEGDREKALDAGCDEYVSKPVNKQILMKMLNIFEG